MSIQDRACHAANRVAVTTGFAVGDVVTEDATNRVLDAFHVTQDLLLELGQCGQLDEIARFLSCGHSLIRPDDPEWNAFVSEQVRQLHLAHLHQKTIEVVGDLLSKWQPEPCAPADFDEALRHLEYIVMLEPESQAESWVNAGKILLAFRMRSFSIVLAGLAVMASNNVIERDRDAFTGVNFGGSLAVDGVSRIVGVD